MTLPASLFLDERPLAQAIAPPPEPPGGIVASEGCGSISMLLEFGKVLSSLCRPLGQESGLPHSSCPGHDDEPASRVKKEEAQPRRSEVRHLSGASSPVEPFQ